jgi:uncharacterized protein
MRAGAEIIYQATFVHGNWRGRADFLERVDQSTTLGSWGSEAVDAKLARAEKPTYVLQLCFYSEAIGVIQGAMPERMHVLLGIGERRTLRLADFAAYYRRVRQGFEAGISHPRATEPYPVEHCALCEFRESSKSSSGRLEVGEALPAPELLLIDPMAALDFAVLLGAPGPNVPVPDPGGFNPQHEGE